MQAHQNQQEIKPQVDDNFWPWPPKRTPNTTSQSRSRSRSSSRSSSMRGNSATTRSHPNDFPDMLQRGRTGLFDVPDNLRTFSRGSLPGSRGRLTGKLLNDHPFHLQQQSQSSQKSKSNSRFNSKSNSRLIPIQIDEMASSHLNLNSGPAINNSLRDSEIQRVIVQIKQMTKEQGATKYVCEKAMDSAIRCGTCPTERQLLQLVRSTYSQFMNQSIHCFLADRETTSRTVLQLQALKKLDERKILMESEANINIKLKDQSSKIKGDIQDAFKSTVKLETEFIQDLLDRECFEEANMFSEQCLNQYFPLLGTAWKDKFQDKIVQARSGVRMEAFQRKQSKKLTKQVDKLLYQGNPLVEEVQKILEQSLSIADKNISEKLKTNRIRLVAKLQKSTEMKQDLKWQTVLDDWRSSVAGAKALEAVNYRLKAELEVAVKGHSVFKNESEDWHKCYGKV